MKKIGLTLLTAFVGGALALGAYRMIENKYADNLSFEEKQKVYFTSNKTAPIVSSTGALDFTEAAAAATPAVVYIRTTYSSKTGGSGQAQLRPIFGDMFGQRMPQRAPQQASGSGVIIARMVIL